MSCINGKQPKISVIIPVYNVEKYLKRCLDSVLNQEFSDIEVILINDGSTDSSSKICDEYQEMDKRVKVIHKKNARVAAARNDGLKIAEGEYISFIDSDDWIQKEMYKEMYKYAIDFNTDVVMCDYTKKGKDSDYTVSQPIREGYYNKDAIEKELFGCTIMFESIDFPPTISNWTCLFKRVFLEKNKIVYDEDIHYCEDSIFGSKVIYRSENFYYMKNRYFYNYFYNPTSTTSKYNFEKWNSYLKVNERLEEYFEKLEYDFTRQLKINMLYFTLNMLSEIGKCDESFYNKIAYCKKIMSNKKVIELFKDFEIPKVIFNLKIVIYLIKYKMSYIYSLLFYKKIKGK